MKKVLCFMITISIVLSIMGISAYADEYTIGNEENTTEREYVLPSVDSNESVSESTEISNEVVDNTEKTDIAENVESVGAPTSDVVTVNVNMLPCMKVIDSVARFELLTKDGKVLGEKEEWIGGITDKFTLSFDVPEYTGGTKFVLRLKEGLSYVKYYADKYYAGSGVELETYSYLNENGEASIANTFDIDGFPIFEHIVIVYIEKNMIKMAQDAKLISNVAMVPIIEFAEQLGLDARYDERYNSVVCEIDGKQAIFNVGTTYATILGEDKFLPVECQVINDTIYAPVRTLADAFEAETEALDFGDHIDVCVGESKVVKEFMDREVINKWNISSRTKYMVWVDKSDYRVRVYTGSKNKWKKVGDFPCAIGAPNSPTITGSFEYQYRVPGWYYGTYYVGPCLVFYGGYALHSTLLYYNNTPYDNRVGVKISHGCVRLHKSDIDWIAERLPIGSRIYVTE